MALNRSDTALNVAAAIQGGNLANIGTGRVQLSGAVNVNSMNLATNSTTALSGATPSTNGLAGNGNLVLGALPARPR